MEEEHKCGRIGKEVVGEEGEEGEEDDEGEEEDRGGEGQGGGGEGAIAKCPARRPFQALQSN